MNKVELEGTIISQPRSRELPSGTPITSFEVQTTTEDEIVTTVPVESPLTVEELRIEEGQQVKVGGYVGRRYFRAGGITQSRTIVVAQTVTQA